MYISQTEAKRRIAAILSDPTHPANNGSGQVDSKAIERGRDELARLYAIAFPGPHDSSRMTSSGANGRQAVPATPERQRNPERERLIREQIALMDSGADTFAIQANMDALARLRD